MIVMARDERDIVLYDEGYKPCGRVGGLNLHAVAPIILGLAAPFLVMSLIAPDALAHIQFMTSLLLISALVACIFIYGVSVLAPGPVTALRVDGKKRRLTVERCGIFANKLREIDCRKIHVLKLIQNFDRDGYGTVEPIAVLRSKEVVQLPAGTTEQHLQALRTVIGCR